MRGEQKEENGSWVRRLRSAVADSAWAPVAAKLGGYGALLLALAAVGSGAAGRLAPSVFGGQAALASLLPAAGAVMLATPDAGDPPPAPDAGPAPAAVEDAGPPADAAAASGITPDGKVLLNVATEAELCRLPGIGPSKAKAIVALRAKLGRLKRPEDLLRVRGIGRRSLARLRPLLVLD